MSRLPRIIVPGIPHHVTQPESRRQRVFTEDDSAHPTHARSCNQEIGKSPHECARMQVGEVALPDVRPGLVERPELGGGEVGEGEVQPNDVTRLGRGSRGCGIHRLWNSAWIDAKRKISRRDAKAQRRKEMPGAFAESSLCPLSLCASLFWPRRNRGEHHLRTAPLGDSDQSHFSSLCASASLRELLLFSTAGRASHCHIATCYIMMRPHPHQTDS